jgi:membrane associated rhomboid family serine protease
MTLILIIITVVVSITAFNNPQLQSNLVFNPYAVKHRKQWYRLITCGLLHADYLHLLVNMFVLYSFGQAVERYYSYTFGNAASFHYVLMYVTAIFAANVSTYYKFQNNPHYNSLGASGAVSAVLFTTILYNPYGKIYFYGFIEIPGILMGVAYLLYSYYMSRKGSGDNINHEAHFYGAIYGMLFTIVFKPSLFLYFIDQLFHFGSQGLE